jgi:RimK family alpha-L-glutamate ligase
VAAAYDIVSEELAEVAAPLVEIAARPAAVVIGKPTPTNLALADAFGALGYGGSVAASASVLTLGDGDLALARLDVLPTLDGTEAGLWRLPFAVRDGGRLLNEPRALLGAHDKLRTALALERAGVPHPRTIHVRSRGTADFDPPYVVKPRFGSWGCDVFRCATRRELAARLEELGGRAWFRRQGALVQQLVEPTGCDLRVVVAGGRVVGAVERVAPLGEWRTNVALGATRRRADASPSARAVALAAVAALGLDLAGVDLLPDPRGGFVVLEVNGAVDFTTDYADDVFAAAAGSLVDAACNHS